MFSNSLLLHRWHLLPRPVHIIPMASRACSTGAPLIHQQTVQLLHKQVVDAQSVPCPSDIKSVHLEPRKMTDSYARVTIPLSGNKKARMRYLTAKGTVRVGRLLEDLDHYAVWLCYLHNRSDPQKIDSPGTLPRSIVTGCVDRIGVHGNQLVDSDITLDGHVTWVGRSSMEAVMRAFQEDRNGNIQQVIKATFVLVSRDPTLNRAIPVHPLITSTPEDAATFHAGAEANAERKYRNNISLLKSAPMANEWNLLHSLFLNNLSGTNQGTYKTALQPGQVWMEDTEVRNTHVCFPEFQNIYGRIFGGFLMREAIELAFICGRYFCKGTVSLVSVDDILFQKSVNVGDIVQFTAKVVYTHEHYMQVRVYAEACDELFREKKMSNVFHVTLTADDLTQVNGVVPGNYAAGMLYLDGKRHFEKVSRFL